MASDAYEMKRVVPNQKNVLNTVDAGLMERNVLLHNKVVTNRFYVQKKGYVPIFLAPKTMRHLTEIVFVLAQDAYNPRNASIMVVVDLKMVYVLQIPKVVQIPSCVKYRENAVM